MRMGKKSQNEEFHNLNYSKYIFCKRKMERGDMGLICGGAGNVNNAHKYPDLKIWRKETIYIKSGIKQICVG
jgi:hypothetical protein